jgi:hypothetical protein
MENLWGNVCENVAVDLIKKVIFNRWLNMTFSVDRFHEVQPIATQ